MSSPINYSISSFSSKEISRENPVDAALTSTQPNLNSGTWDFDPQDFEALQQLSGKKTSEAALPTLLASLASLENGLQDESDDTIGVLFDNYRISERLHRIAQSGNDESSERAPRLYDDQISNRLRSILQNNGDHPENGNNSGAFQVQPLQNNSIPTPGVQAPWNFISDFEHFDNEQFNVVQQQETPANEVQNLEVLPQDEKRRKARENLRRHRAKQLETNPEEFRRKKNEAEQRYRAKQRETNPEEFRRKYNEATQRYKAKQLETNPEEFRRKQNEARQRYIAKQRETNPEEYRRKKNEQTKKSQAKKKEMIATAQVASSSNAGA